jgi:glycosyltransferase involved in cell wall biosynthesis
MKVVAIVIPWFGQQLKGGAEQQAWQVANRLAARGYRMEVLTTCCRSFMDDWAENHLSPGCRVEDKVTVRRFPVDRRNRAAFDRLNARLLTLSRRELIRGVPPVSEEESALFVSENINSTALSHYLKDHATNYHAFIFLPYLYGPILNGLPLVAKRAFLQPCLHDEAYAYLPEIEVIFHKAHRLLFNSDGERELALRLYGPAVFAKGVVTGEGIEFDDLDSAGTERLPEQLRNKCYVLCLGRRDTTKNVDFLVSAFRTFKQTNAASNLRLVLAGPGHHTYNDEGIGLVDLGVVPAEEKSALLRQCVALFQPSINESFSRVMMEAWFCRRPVVVHRDCLATSIAVRAANGGWIAGDSTQWADMFRRIECASEGELTACGDAGHRYATTQAIWDIVIDQYESALGLKDSIDTKVVATRKGLKTIHQLLPNLSYGDAISNHAIAIRNHLRSLGYRSDIFVCYIDPRVANECHRLEKKSLHPDDGLIYHHSVGSEITPFALAHRGPKCLIYHNITPAEFFAPYRPKFAALLRRGRKELKQLATSFPLSAGVSHFNATELAANGFVGPLVLPIALDPARWDRMPSATLMRALQDGTTNLLSVGRYTPNKCQHHLVEAFAEYLTMDANARLILVGSGDPSDPYVQHLHTTIQRLRLNQHVLLPNLVDDGQLLAYYRTAHLFWSMSEHEGFCVPLIEAMWFDVPVLAFKSSAVPETLAGAGIMFTTKQNWVEVAALAKIIVRDTEIRGKIIKQQRMRRQDFLPTRTWQVLDRIIASLESHTAQNPALYSTL